MSFVAHGLWLLRFLQTNTILFYSRELLSDDPSYLVPEVIDELTTHEILATEFVEGLPLDKCFELDQESKNKVSIVVCNYAHCHTNLQVSHVMKNQFMRYANNKCADQTVHACMRAHSDQYLCRAVVSSLKVAEGNP